jgi:sulfoxide reductase heme-binding subunit YedZ
MSVLAVTLSPTWYWYFTRGTGFVALLLLTAIMVLGILGPLRVSSPRWPRFAVETLHRDLSLLAILVIVAHVLTTVLDGYAPIGVIDALVPFHSAYRTLWLGLGTVAFDLMLALIVTSLLRRRVGRRSWRLIHWLAYASWPIAVLHGIGTGSDAAAWWSVLLTATCVLCVAVAGAARVTRAIGLAGSWRAAAVAATVAVPVAAAIVTVAGPLAPHWAARAGTPSEMIEGSR